MKIRKAIETRKPVYSARALEHEYLENVSRIDRLSTFRGPRSAVHRSSRVAANLEVAKSMRATRHLPGTDGYQRVLSRTMTRNRSQSAHAWCASVALHLPLDLASHQVDACSVTMMHVATSPQLRILPSAHHWSWCGVGQPTVWPASFGVRPHGSSVRFDGHKQMPSLRLMDDWLDCTQR